MVCLVLEFIVFDDSIGCNSCNYDGCLVCCGNNNCMLLCFIDVQYYGGLVVQQVEDSGVQVIIEVVVYCLEYDDKGCIVVVYYYDWNKVSYCIIVQIFVLVVNVIEIFKLLLMLVSDKFLQGIVNVCDNVGCNLCDYLVIGVIFDVDEEIWFGCGLVSFCFIGQFCDGDFCKEYVLFCIDIFNVLQVVLVIKEVFVEGYFGKCLEEQILFCVVCCLSIKNVLE